MIQNSFNFFIEGFQTASTFDWTLFGVAGIYIVLMCVLTIGILLNRPTKAFIPKTGSLPSVTVLVSARNEERDIPACIDSLLALDYPKEKLQIILIDDRSTDKTGELIEEAAKNNEHVLALHTVNMSETHLEAKARGISYGFRHATGEWVFITDADAIVNPKWISHSFYNLNEKTGMLGGSLMVQPNGVIGIIERISWAFTQMFNLGMSGYKMPFICVGPNMAIRKSIYDAAGGLEKAVFNVAEDLALFKMVVDAGYWAETHFSYETMAELRPVPSLKHLFSQQHRWFRGGLEGGLQYIFILFFAFSWGYIFAFYSGFGWLSSPALFLCFTIMAMFINSLFFLIQKKRLKLDKHLRYVPVLYLYLPFFAIFVLPFLFFRKQIDWMGDNYIVSYHKAKK